MRPREDDSEVVDFYGVLSNVIVLNYILDKRLFSSSVHGMIQTKKIRK